MRNNFFLFLFIFFFLLVSTFQINAQTDDKVTYGQVRLSIGDGKFSDNFSQIITSNSASYVGRNSQNFQTNVEGSISWNNVRNGDIVYLEIPTSFLYQKCEAFNVIQAIREITIDDKRYCYMTTFTALPDSNFGFKYVIIGEKLVDNTHFFLFGSDELQELTWVQLWVLRLFLWFLPVFFIGLILAIRVDEAVTWALTSILILVMIGFIYMSVSLERNYGSPFFELLGFFWHIIVMFCIFLRHNILEFIRD